MSSQSTSRTDKFDQPAPPRVCPHCTMAILPEEGHQEARHKLPPRPGMRTGEVVVTHAHCADAFRRARGLNVEPKPKDKDVPHGDKWEFDGNVTEVFDDMLERSIPQYEVMRRAVTDAAVMFAQKGTTILDLGCSRGEALWQVATSLPSFAPYHFVGVEVSEPMRRAAEDRFGTGKPNHEGPVAVILGNDLREGLPWLDCSVIMSVLTLMFVPIEHRQRVLHDVHAKLRAGGAFIMVEKVLGSSHPINDYMTRTYHGLKEENGYSGREIERKALALEGVLVPVTARWNEELLAQAGFKEVDCIWRWMNFAAWLAIK